MLSGRVFARRSLVGPLPEVVGLGLALEALDGVAAGVGLCAFALSLSLGGVTFGAMRSEMVDCSSYSPSSVLVLGEYKADSPGVISVPSLLWAPEDELAELNCDNCEDLEPDL